MNVRKLPSGNYFARKMIDGVSYTFTFDHKPTKRELEDALYEKRKSTFVSNVKNSFRECALNYIESKKAVLSPSTINSYESIIKNLSEEFLNMKISKINALAIQKEVNDYSVGRSPKTVKNASGFISAVVWFYKPDMPIKTKLPQNVKVETYIPTDDEVETLIEALKGSPYEAVILLTILGLRKSEALAITASDIDGNILTVNKALVVNSQGEYVLKTTKTESSTRKIYIPDHLRDLILSKGKAYKGFPGNILRELHRIQDRNGLKRCKLHALRHYYVSKAHAMGVPDASIAAAVGHKSIATTQRIYTHAQTDKQIAYEQSVAKSIL